MVFDITDAALVALVLNTLSRAMLLFLIASGLSLIFGLMGVINFAHGAFFALGAYGALLVLGFFPNFWVALLLAPILVGLLGVVMEYLTLRPIYDQEPIYQVLLTFGVAIVIEESIQFYWGGNSLAISGPEEFTGIMMIGPTYYSKFRVFVICLGILVAILLWLVITRSQIGMIIRAGQEDAEMVEIMGINNRALFTGMFGVGVALAALGGVIAGPMLSAYPMMGSEYLIDSFLVIIIGGVGSIGGIIVGALIVGGVRSFAGTIIGGFGGIFLYSVLILVLVFRPYGILGEPGMLDH
jgi:branched-subunit amino acid ABC-type transport system permease component